MDWGIWYVLASGTCTISKKKVNVRGCRANEASACETCSSQTHLSKYRELVSVCIAWEKSAYFGIAELQNQSGYKPLTASDYQNPVCRWVFLTLPCCVSSEFIRNGLAVWQLSLQWHFSTGTTGNSVHVSNKGVVWSFGRKWYHATGQNCLVCKYLPHSKAINEECLLLRIPLIVNGHKHEDESIHDLQHNDRTHTVFIKYVGEITTNHDLQDVDKAIWVSLRQLYTISTWDSNSSPGLVLYRSKSVFFILFHQSRKVSARCIPSTI